MAFSRTYRVMGALFLVAGMLVVPAVPAAGDDGVAYRGNPKCEDLGATWTTLYKADFDEGAPASGSHGPVTWGVRSTDNGEVVDWTSTTALSAVLVKGGPGGYQYVFSAAGGTGGAGLHALERPSGAWADISHVTFCQAQQPPPRPATVTILKQMVPPDAGVAFTFTSSLPGFPVDLGHNQSATVEVDAGSYSVSEAAISGWALSDIDCTGGSGAVYDLATGTADLTVAAGDEVTCTFTNEQEVEPEPATLTLKKLTNPANDDVTFRFFGPDNWKPVLGHGDSSTIEVEPGTYTLREKFEHAWDLTSIVCDGGRPVVDLAAGTAIVTAGEGDDITCTFTNTVTCPQHGYIAIEKYTSPVDASVPFAFTSDALSREGDPFLPVLHHGESDYVMVKPGTYSITELPVAGWQLAGLTCDDPDAVVDLGAATATVTVSPSELATCVFTNSPVATPEPGRLVIEKRTSPSGATDTWAFTSDIDGFAPLLGDGESAFVTVEAGSYTVTEQIDDDWTLTGLVCTDPEAQIDLASGSATVSIAAGETVTCTYTNTEVPVPEPGKVIIEKVTVPSGADEEFRFVVSMPGEDWFETVGPISDGESATVEFTTPGPRWNEKYVEIGEFDVEGWDLTDITCDDFTYDRSIDDGNVVVEVDPGETVTCTFTNTLAPARGVLRVEKVTDPAGAKDTFSFETTVGGFAPELGDGEHASVPVREGSYSVTELAQDGWRLTAIRCTAKSMAGENVSVGDPPAEADLAAGRITVFVPNNEIVTCTFANSLEPPLGSIGDYVWNDVNRNGVQDLNEPGIGGVRVNLYTPDLELLATTHTDSAGLYEFPDLAGGDYVVEFTGIPSGYSFTTPFAAARTIDSDAATSNGRTPVMALPEGYHDTTCDAGLYIVQGPTGGVVPVDNPPSGETLPVTGANLELPLTAGAALLALGLVLVLATRPKRAKV